MKTWQINPNTAIALNIVLGVLSALSAPTIHFLGFTADTSVILAWDGMICLVLNGVLHGYSSSMPGPLAPPDPPSVKAATALAAKTASALILLGCLMGLGLLGAPSTARAATLRVAQNGGLGGALVNSVTGRHPAVSKSTVSTGAQSLPAAIASAGAKIQAFTVGDLQNAIDLANAQTPPDTRHGACWQAALPVAQAWQLPAIIPNQLGLATAVQTYFDAQASLTLAKLLPDSVVTACALTVSDLQISFAQLATALGVSAVALPKLPVIP